MFSKNPPTPSFEKGGKRGILKGIMEISNKLMVFYIIIS
jgi:hypothetical protein